MNLLSVFDDSIISDIISLNEVTSMYQLKLSSSEVKEIVNTRNISLRNIKRVEFRESSVKLIILEFCKSSYISKDEWASTLNELVSIFYHLRSMVSDNVSDKCLVNSMFWYFEGDACGSIELLKDFCYEGDLWI